MIDFSIPQDYVHVEAVRSPGLRHMHCHVEERGRMKWGHAMRTVSIPNSNLQPSNLQTSTT